MQVQEQTKNQSVITRQCTKCGRTLPLSEFSQRKRGKYGKQSVCKQCSSKNPEKYKQIPEYQMRNGIKKCSTCKIVQPISEFHKSSGCPDGYNYKCKTCRLGHNIGRDIYTIKYDANQVYYWYIEEERSLSWIGKMVNANYCTVGKWIQKLGLQKRSTLEQAKISSGQYAKHNKPLRELIRGSHRGNVWKKNVLNRDGAQCQHCGSDKKICVHHIIDIYMLVKKFLLLYPQYNIEKDKLILVELSQNYEPLWNESNGITLCWDCHCKEHNFDFSSKARPYQEKRKPVIKYIVCESCGISRRCNGYERNPITGKRESICSTCKYGIKNGLKICRKCKIKYNISYYTKNIKESDYLSRYCKACVKIAKDKGPKRQPNSVCQKCRSGFYSHPSRKKIGRGKFCSKECANKSRHIILKCKNCEKDFERNKGAVRGYKKHFCCSECMYIYYKNGGKNE